MKIIVEIEHPQLNRARIDVNKQTLVDAECNKMFSYTFDISESTDVELWFWPWKIKPFLRLDGHMMDYGLLKINQYDHQLQFTLHKNYLDRYSKNLIQSRIDSQFPDGNVIQKLYESAIGYGLDYSELIQEIKAKLNT